MSNKTYYGDPITPGQTGPHPDPSTEITIFACGPNDQCAHDFKGWREFEGGMGGETVCTKCGIGAMQHSLWTSE